MRTLLNTWLNQDENRTLEDAMKHPLYSIYNEHRHRKIDSIAKYGPERISDGYDVVYEDGMRDPVLHSSWIVIDAPKVLYEYSVVHTSTVAELVEIVNQMIKSENGWSVQGGITFDGRNYLQALVREK